MTGDPDDPAMLREQLSNACATIERMQAQAHLRNVQLDALHWVWCSGGCRQGVHRWTGLAPLTEEVVAQAERNTQRMREWLRNAQFRAEQEAVGGKPS